MTDAQQDTLLFVVLTAATDDALSTMVSGMMRGKWPDGWGPEGNLGCGAGWIPHGNIFVAGTDGFPPDLPYKNKHGEEVTDFCWGICMIRSVAEPPRPATRAEALDLAHFGPS